MTQAQTSTARSPSSSSVELVAVDPAELGEAWPVLRALLATALAMTKKVNFETLRARLEAELAQAWIVVKGDDQEIKGAIITSIEDTGARKFLQMLIAGGRDARSWFDTRPPYTGNVLNRLEEFARDEGCEAIESVGRRGWEKLLPAEYVEIERVFSKEIVKCPQSASTGHLRVHQQLPGVPSSLT